MAATASNYLENLVVENTIRNATKYIALFTTAPSDYEAGTGGTEATGGSYARKVIAFGAPSNGVSSNSALLTFTLGTDIAAGTYTAYAIYDAATAGNYVWGEALGANRTLTVTGDSISFAIGGVVATVT